MFECGVISTEYFGNSLGFGTRCEWDIYKSAPRQPVRLKFFFFVFFLGDVYVSTHKSRVGSPCEGNL